MARTSTRNINPSLSSDPRDKLLAALNWLYGKLKHATPTTEHRCISMLAWNGTSGCRRISRKPAARSPTSRAAHKDAAESIAASLPPAPRCPL